MILPMVNAHEHLESRNEVPALLEANDQVGIATTVLVGSPRYTITLKPGDGFEGHHQNNSELLEVARLWPGKFRTFPALWPLDPGNEEWLNAYLAAGASGIKLYHGNGGSHGQGPFACVPVDDPRLDPVLARCEREGIPVIFHVNLLLFEDQLWSLLSRFPTIRMVVPHLMLCKRTSTRLARVADLLTSFPHLYTDLSFGRPDYLADALKQISDRPETCRAFISKWAHRIMVGSDMVVTAGKVRRGTFIVDTLRTYRHLLEREQFITRCRPGELLSGLALPPEILEQLYTKTFASLIEAGWGDPCRAEVPATVLA